MSPVGCRLSDYTGRICAACEGLRCLCAVHIYSVQPLYALRHMLGMLDVDNVSANLRMCCIWKLEGLM